MKKWECTICGYIHEGDAPPDECPICGAGPEYFTEIIEKQEATLTDVSAQSAEPAGSEPAAGGGEPTGLTALVLKFHLHPITVHSPNGVLPVALIFLVLAMVLGLAGFEKASFYNFVFVLLTLPVVIMTGIMEWRNRYRGAMTKIFVTKIAASIIVTTTLLVLVVWRALDPAVATSGNRWIYLLLGIVMVGAVGIAGHMGGKLVFDTRDR